MQYAYNNMTDLMGIGSHVGEIREGPDGQLYEWVEGVDGLGNPIGFWKVFKKIARAALPFTKFIPGVGPAIYAAGSLAKRAGLLGTGRVAQGEDGQLYEYVEGVDGLGNPVGFFKPLRRFASGLLRKVAPKIVGKLPFVGTVKRFTRPFCQYLPRLRPCAQQIPHAMPIFNTGTKVCRVLKSVGLAGAYGEPYQLVEGIGEFGERVRLIVPAHIQRGAAGRGRPIRRRRVRR